MGGSVGWDGRLWILTVCSLNACVKSFIESLISIHYSRNPTRVTEEFNYERSLHCRVSGWNIHHVHQIMLDYLFPSITCYKQMKLMHGLIYIFWIILVVINTTIKLLGNCIFSMMFKNCDILSLSICNSVYEVFPTELDIIEKSWSKL